MGLGCHLPVVSAKKTVYASLRYYIYILLHSLFFSYFSYSYHCLYYYFCSINYYYSYYFFIVIFFFILYSSIYSTLFPSLPLRTVIRITFLFLTAVFFLRPRAFLLLILCQLYVRPNLLSSWVKVQVKTDPYRL